MHRLVLLAGAVLSVVVGVASGRVVAALVETRDERAAVDRLLAPNVYSLLAADGGSLSVTLLDDIRELPGVDSVAGQWPLEVLLLQTSSYRHYIAPTTADYLSVRGLSLSAGREARADGECVIGQRAAEVLLEGGTTPEDWVGARLRHPSCSRC